MANNIDAFIPELWAQESLAILEENMVAANLIHRDFSNEISSFGDVVNTRKPGEFTAKRKTNSDNVTIQDVTATNVQVLLDQHIHTSFIIKDGEESKSFKDLVNEYLNPAMLSIGRMIDQIVLGQTYHFVDNYGGSLGNLTDTNAKSYILDTRKSMNENKAYVTGRNLILSPGSETELLKLDTFITADKIGDDGTALREASLGRKLGFDMWMCQNSAAPSAGNTTDTNGAVDGAQVKGTTALTVNGFTGDDVSDGSWIDLGGYLYQVTASALTGGATTQLTITPGLKELAADAAPISVYSPGAVNLVAGYASGYSGPIVIDGFTVAPQVGQLVTFGTSATKYSAVETSLTSITLDRPLEAAIANNDAVNIGPAGSYNFAFHKNALALVVRPLAQPKAGTGALSAVANFNGLAIRVVITYDGDKQGHLVTLDLLCGIKVLDTALGAVMLG